MTRKHFSSCKGQTGALNVIVLIIAVIAFVFISFYSKMIFNDLVPSMDAELKHNESIAMKNNLSSTYPGYIDGLVGFIFFGLWVFVIAGSYFFDEHPLLFGISIILMIFILIAAVILGNFYEEMFAGDEMSSLAAEFPLANWILTHQLQVIIGVIASALIAMYAKMRQ